MDPRYEGRLEEIKKRWTKLSKNTGNLREQDKRAALGTEVWGSNMLAKVNSNPHTAAALVAHAVPWCYAPACPDMHAPKRYGN